MNVGVNLDFILRALHQREEMKAIEAQGLINFT